MCGLTGYLLNHVPIEKDEKILRGLLIANQERGADSSGVAYCSGNQATIYKDKIPAISLVPRLPTNPATVAIGHTRLATTGKVTKANAHPFTKGNIIGAHNGIVSNHLEIDNKVQVDSEVIFQLINDVGYIEAFKKLRGSFALVWYDLRTPGCVYMVRHTNPLYCVKTEGGYFWSSQWDHLIPTVYQHYAPEYIDIQEDVVYCLQESGSIEHVAVTFKEYVYTPDDYKPWGTKNWEHEDAYDRYDRYLEDQIADHDDVDNQVIPTSALDTDQPIRDAVWDIANNEGCSICHDIPGAKVWCDVDGYVYCEKHKHSGEGVQLYDFSEGI